MEKMTLQMGEECPEMFVNIPKFYGHYSSINFKKQFDKEI